MWKLIPRSLSKLLKFMRKNNRGFLTGFTLIEVVIYSALLAVFLGFAFVSAQNVFSVNSSLLGRSELAANEELVHRTVAWLVRQASGIDAPLQGGSSPTAFTLRTYDVATDPAVLVLSGEVLSLSLAGGPSVPLTNDAVRVTAFTASHISNAQTSASLRVAFTLEDADESALTSSPNFLFLIP
jgi:type II secretory pathway component PulJ